MKLALLGQFLAEFKRIPQDILHFPFFRINYQFDLSSIFKPRILIFIFVIKPVFFHVLIVADNGYFLSPIFGPKFLSVHNLWVVADAGGFLSPIFGPKFSPSVRQFWVVADDGYFFSSIFGPQFFFSQVVADNGHLLDQRT